MDLIPLLRNLLCFYSVFPPEVPLSGSSSLRLYTLKHIFSFLRLSYYRFPSRAPAACHSAGVNSTLSPGAIITVTISVSYTFPL